MKNWRRDKGRKDDGTGRWMVKERVLERKKKRVKRRGREEEEQERRVAIDWWMNVYTHAKWCSQHVRAAQLFEPACHDGTASAPVLIGL